MRGENANPCLSLRSEVREPGCLIQLCGTGGYSNSLQGKEAAMRRESNLLPGTRCPERVPPLTCYALQVVASLVHLPHEELQADDGINDDDEEHKEGNVQQRHHGLDDGVQDHLETCATKSTVAATEPPPPRLSQCCPRYHANTTSWPPAISSTARVGARSPVL